MTCECGRPALIRISAIRNPRSLTARKHKTISKRDHPLCRICWQALLIGRLITPRTQEDQKMTPQEILHYLAPRCIKGRPHIGTKFGSTGPIQYVGYVDQHGTIHPCGTGASLAHAVCDAQCEVRCPSRR